uniref:F-box domain-containing protein n=2 Tax=Moniliophthora roreri TaxID=221103 RepID=A0A0W0F4Q8_MONRR
MPKVSSVEICCKLRMIGVSPQRYVLMPKDALPPPGKAYLFPPLLETLVICNPSLTDNVLRRLPHSLKCLVLDFVPYWDRVMASGDLLSYHMPDKLIHTFRAMHHAMGIVPNLEHLRINMGWCITPELLKQICVLFPGLRILELQGIRYFNRGGEPESDLYTFATTLSQLHYLESLKLAVELKEDPYRDDGLRKIGSVDESSQTWANTLATRIPALRSVAFEIRAHTGKSIGSRSLVGEPLWLWYFLSHKRDKHVMRRSDEPLDWDFLDKSFRW